MPRRLLSLVLVLGLLVPALAGVAAAKGGHGKSNGIEVRSVRYDAGAGELTTTVRWNTRELKKDGSDALHVVVFHDGDAPQVLDDQTVVATPRNHVRTHRITLSPEQRDVAGDGRHLVVVATHKHDDDGGLFDRIWHDRRAVDATARDANAALACGPIQPYANLTNCNLTGANMTNANLTWANLTGANVTGANLTGANLTHVNLSNARGQFTNLTGANLTNAVLIGGYFSEANLDNANLTNARLDYANLSGANLSGAIFCNTTMEDGSINNDNC